MKQFTNTKRKGDKFFIAVWKSGIGTDYMNGRDIAEAFGNHGYGGGALAALDYWKQVYPCQSEQCDFYGNTPEEKRKHRCWKECAA
jgi:hypothetical protein